MTRASRISFVVVATITSVALSLAFVWPHIESTATTRSLIVGVITLGFAASYTLVVKLAQSKRHAIALTMTAVGVHAALYVSAFQADGLDPLGLGFAIFFGPIASVLGIAIIDAFIRPNTNASRTRRR